MSEIGRDPQGSLKIIIINNNNNYYYFNTLGMIVVDNAWNIWFLKAERIADTRDFQENIFLLESMEKTVVISRASF